MAILIRHPYNTEKYNRTLDGFSTFMQRHFVVFINSAYTLGRERYTAAHELYHLIYDKDVIMRKRVLGDKDENEKRADTFAAEFLMPEEGVLEYVHNRINKPLQPKHIIRLQHQYQVSYIAMLRRLRDLGICKNADFERLEEYCKRENAELLQQLTIKEGFSTELIQASNTVSIPQRFIEIFIDNYESGKISLAKFSSLLNIIGKKPEDYGFKKVVNEDAE